MNAGIYQIRNLRNGKRYIGSSVNLNRRFLVHRSRLRKQLHSCFHLQAAWIKYGEHCFIFEAVLICAKEDLLFYEQRTIDTLKPYDSTNGYNHRIKAESNYGLNHPHTEETKQKISNTKKGNVINSMEARRKMSIAKRGKPSPRCGIKLTDEHKKKLSLAHIGKKRTPEHKKNISEACKRRTHSDDTKLKLRKLNLGPLNPRYGKPPWNKGKQLSEEYRKKLSDAAKRRPSNRKGCKCSEESKLRMSIAQKAVWEIRRAAAFAGH